MALAGMNALASPTARLVLTALRLVPTTTLRSCASIRLIPSLPRLAMVLPATATAGGERERIIAFIVPARMLSFAPQLLGGHLAAAVMFAYFLGDVGRQCRFGVLRVLAFAFLGNVISRLILQLLVFSIAPA